MKIRLSKRERDLVIRVILVVGVLFGAFKGIEHFHAQYAAEQSKISNRLQQEERDYRERLATINEEEQLQQEFAVSYQQFVELGVIGEEQRLNWIETLQNVARKRRLFELAYKIGSRSTLESNQSAFTSGSTIRIQASEMELAMSMLHDLDFMMFLEDYSQNADGIFIPLYCRMRRLGAGPGGVPLIFQVELKENLAGDCTVEWLSVEDPDRGQNRSAEGA